MQLADILNKTHPAYYMDADSPTQYQLMRAMQSVGIRPTHWAWRAQFSARNLQFSPAACECLEFKHKLAQLIQCYCPSVAPETYLIDDLSWSTVLSEIAEIHYTINHKLVDKVDDLVWILKPALLNNGQHIKIFDELSQIEEHFLSPTHVGGPHVLQRYITDPDLENSRKYSLRYFVVITQEAGAFLYQQGYLNVALASYSNDYVDLSPHVTNEHLHLHAASVEQIPMTSIARASAWYPQVRSIVQSVSKGLEQAYPQAFEAQKDRTFAVFGFDFILDSQQKMWLLEVNHGPCFPIEENHPLQQSLYQPFWNAMLQQFVLPIIKKKPMNIKGCAGFEAMRT